VSDRPKLPDRAYTVAEIDALTEICERRIFGYLIRHSAYSDERDREREVRRRVQPIHEMVRTYMLAGLTAADFTSEPTP
jgi:hypothetical protein